MNTGKVTGLVVAVVLMAVLFPAGVFAQATGTIEGKVVDAQTGVSPKGARVIVEGAGLAAPVGRDGSYVIIDVPVGSQRVTVTIPGYTKMTKEVAVSAHEGATVNFELNRKAVYELEKLVVTETPTITELKHVPGSASVITKHDIDVRNILNANKALMQIPGIYVKSGKNPMSGGGINVRGVSENRTQVVLDGSRLNNSFYGGVNWGQIPVENIERIEVMPGPFSALYGGWMGLGGTIKVVTRMPEKQEFFIKGAYGSDELRGGTVSYGNKFFDKLSVYLSYNYNEVTEGYETLLRKSAGSGSGGAATSVTGLEKITTSKGDTQYVIGKQENPSREWNLLSKFRLDLPNDSKFTFTYWPSGSKTCYGSPQSYLRDAATGELVDSGRVTFDDEGPKNINLGTTFLGKNVYSGEEYRYIVDYEMRLNPEVAFKTSLEYYDGKKKGYSISPATGATPSGGPGNLYKSPTERWQGRIEGKAMNIFGFNTLTFGLDYMEEEGGRKRYDDTTNWTDVHTKGEMTATGWGTNRVISLFVQDEMVLLDDRLTLYLGGRLDMWEISGLMDWSKYTGITTTYSDRNENYFSPKFSVKYALFEPTILSLSLAKAFTIPRLHDITGGYSTPTHTRYSSPYLKPEKATSWEAAVDQKIGEKLHGRATYFENDIHDLQYWDKWRENNIDYSISRNAGKSKIKGFELSADYQIAYFLKAYANMTYQDAKVIKNINEPETEGKRITGVPQEMYNFGFIGDYAGFTGSVTGRYVGKVYSDSLNRDKKNNVSGSYDPFLTIDMKVGYEVLKGMEISFAVDNLLDKDYYQGADKALGRTWFGAIEYRF